MSSRPEFDPERNTSSNPHQNESPYKLPEDPPTHLEPAEKRIYDILREAGRVPLTRETIFRAITATGIATTPQNVNSTLNGLRTKLAQNESQPFRITNISPGGRKQAYYIGHHIDDPEPLPEVPEVTQYKRPFYTHVAQTLSPITRDKLAREREERKKAIPLEVEIYLRQKEANEDLENREYVRNMATGKIWIVEKKGDNIILASVDDKGITSMVPASLFEQRYTPITIADLKETED